MWRLRVKKAPQVIELIKSRVSARTQVCLTTVCAPSVVPRSLPITHHRRGSFPSPVQIQEVSSSTSLAEGAMGITFTDCRNSNTQELQTEESLEVLAMLATEIQSAVVTKVEDLE